MPATLRGLPAKPAVLASVAAMVPAEPTEDPVAALNEVLSEVLDVVADVKQAHRKVPENHALHAELDQLRVDLVGWAGVLMDEDDVLGVSALGAIPSTAGRTPPNRWPGDAADDDVRRVLGDHLRDLARRLDAAVAAQDDSGPASVLEEIAHGVERHLGALQA